LTADRRPFPDLLLVAGLALLVRVIYVLQLAHTPFFDLPIVDAEYHDAWAREILRLGPGHEGVFFRAPLYPYFLALVYHLFEGSYLAARLAQALLGAATASLTWLLAWETTRRRGIALAAGLGAALYGMLVYFDGELLVETLFIPLLLAAAWAYARRRNGGGLPWFLAAGLLLGLSAITRPSSLVLLPVWIVDLLLQRGPLRRRLLYPAILLAAAFLPILPVTWHNARQGDAVLIATQGGLNFYLGNNPQADGLHSILPGLGTTWDVPAASLAAYRAAGRDLTPSQVGAWYSRQARLWMVDHPGDAARLALKKFCAFWNRLEISNNRDLYFFMGETALLPWLRKLGFWLVGPLGLLGWFLALRRRLLPGWLLAFIPLYLAGVVAFFVTARFRAPLIPFLLICAALAAAHLLRRPRFSRGKAAAWAGLIILALFVNVNPWGPASDNRAHSHFALGNAYLKRGDAEAAVREYRRALEADPRYPQAHLNLGVAAWNRGQADEAVRQYEAELALDPRCAKAWNNLAAVRFMQGHMEEAARLYRRALEIEPHYADARLNLAECLFRQGVQAARSGQTVPAADLLAEALEWNGRQPQYHYNYALILGRLGESGAARRHLEMALELAPDLAAARDLLARLQDTSGAGQPLP